MPVGGHGQTASALLPATALADGIALPISISVRTQSAVRWANLAAISNDAGQDQDGDWHFHGYLLHRANAVSCRPAAQPADLDAMDAGRRE